MLFSIIIPSYNQEKYIRSTLENLVDVKRMASARDISIELILIDNVSVPAIIKIIEEFRTELDHVDISKDKGQYDAINKGISVCKGDYWSWLNTDDYIDPEGFIKLTELLKTDPSIDYIYGDILYIDEIGHPLKLLKAKPLDVKTMVNWTPGIYQPGSFFKKTFTDKIGLLNSYRCSFDYEYVLRCLQNGAKTHRCDFTVSKFRYHHESKTGSLIPVFIREQLSISKGFGRKKFSFLTWFSLFRLFKHKLFPR